MPACAEVNRAMQELSGVKYTTSEQNKEMGKARQHRHMKDTHTLLLTLSDRNPFTGVPYLRNIMTGVNVNGDVNVFNAKITGEKIMDSMTGNTVAQFTFKRSHQAITLQSRSSVRVSGEQVKSTQSFSSSASSSRPTLLTTRRCYSGSSCAATNRPR